MHVNAHLTHYKCVQIIDRFPKAIFFAPMWYSHIVDHPHQILTLVVIYLSQSLADTFLTWGRFSYTSSTWPTMSYMSYNVAVSFFNARHLHICLLLLVHVTPRTQFAIRYTDLSFRVSIILYVIVLTFLCAVWAEITGLSPASNLMLTVMATLRKH